MGTSRTIAAMAIPVRGDTAEWFGDLRVVGPVGDAAVARLHDLLLRVTRGEIRRRGGALRISGPELDDLAQQAADDAVMAILRKLDQFRGESRFTTWAYKFAILEVSSKIGRHFWRTPDVSLDAEDWDRLPDRFGFDPVEQSQWRDLVAAMRDAVQTDLTEHQRRIFIALVLNGVPLDALVIELGTTRNAIYKTLFDARRKLRAALDAHGYLDDAGRRT
jgi:RNA polymerase sigma-70 factor (ECF subfamily)